MLIKAAFRIGVVVVCLLLNPWVRAADIPLSVDLKAGPHPVGFRVVHRYDSSREFKPAIQPDGLLTLGERGRPMQIGIWYPCRKANLGAPMLYEKYLRSAPFDLMPPGQSPRPIEDLLQWMEMSPTHEGVKRTLSTTTAAYWEAPPAEGQRPVVVYSPSLEAPLYENSVLFEYLASHGYIIVSSPAFHERLREMTSFPTYEDLDAQARDLEYCISFVREIPQANRARMAGMGYSIGGLANFLAAVRAGQFASLVMFDSSALYHFESFREKPYFSRISELELPVLFAVQSEKFYAKNLEPARNQRRDFLGEIAHSDAWWLECRHLTHAHFSSLFNYLWKSREVMEGEPTVEVALQDYSVLCRYVRQFLDAHLLKNQEALKFLHATVEENGTSAEAFTMQKRPARTSPASTLGFAHRVRESGFANLLETYRAIVAMDPEFKLADLEINSWANQLLTSRRTNEALAVYQLSVSLYPTSSPAQFGLAETFRAMGNQLRAQELYRKILESSSNSVEAIQARIRLEK